MRYVLLLSLLLATSAQAADVVKTIGATGADYTTIANWEADLDDGTNAAINTTAYGSGDVAIGELIDANYAQTLTVTINGGGTAGLSQIVLRPSSGNVHDGTPGSGAKVTTTGAGIGGFYLTSSIPILFEDLEIHNVSSGTWSAGINIDINGTGLLTVRRCILSADGVTKTNGTNIPIGVYATSGESCIIENSLFLNHNSGTRGHAVWGNFATSVTVRNCTIVGANEGIQNTNTTTWVAQNCAVINCETADVVTSGTATWTSIITSDGTQGTQTTQTLGELFVDTASGDYTPTTGSDLIDAGTDLGSGDLAIDLKQRNRDSEGDTWDVGAIESVGSSPTYTIPANLNGNLNLHLNGNLQ